MAAGFIIPNIFTATNQVSPTLSVMRKDVMGFAGQAEQAFNRMDRAAASLTPSLDGIQKKMLELVATGAVLGAAFQLGTFSFEQLADYEVAVDSFRVIVSDLNDTDFSKFQNKIDEVAKNSKRSGTEVAQAFEKIAGINATFAETADGLGQVSAASIVLAKAARMDLGVAAENLVGIMNQFSFSAGEANRTINVLAAGQAIGAASITQTAEAFTVFGSVAAGSNVTLEQSVGLIQTLGKYSLFGAEAGTKLRGVMLRLQKAGIGYASGQFNINDALSQTNALLGKLKTSKEKDMIINKLFGVENVTAGRILLNNVKTYQDFTKSVTGTSEAQKAAEINSGNLRTTIQQLGAAWVNYLTTSPKVASFMTTISDAAKWLANNLEDVVDVVSSAVKWFLIYKGTMLAARSILFGYNVILGINNALTLSNTSLLGKNAVALSASAIAEKGLAAWIAISTGNIAAFNAALGLTPFGLVILGLAALVVGVYELSEAEANLRKEYEKNIQLDNSKILSQQSVEVRKLAEYYFDLGMGIEAATASAIRARDIFIKMQRAESEAKIVSLKRDLKNEQNTLYAADLFNGGGTPEVGKRAEIAQALLAEQIKARGLAVSNQGNVQFAKSQVDAGQIKTGDLRGLYDTQSVKGDDYSKQRYQYTAPEVNYLDRKDEIKVTIENNTDGVAKVSLGKSRAVDVMPKTESTKVLNR